ncbi:MAG TPA: hypothetical protein VHC69_10055 [Polyangiaceae bacterium]|nr:hypothetical protein [Polyangiaceae bacterium]
MAPSTANLVHHVLPEEVSLRQLVLSRALYLSVEVHVHPRFD